MAGEHGAGGAQHGKADGVCGNRVALHVGLARGGPDASAAYGWADLRACEGVLGIKSG